MKTFCTILIFLLAGIRLFGQSFFTQNATWIKNQLKQIALWEVYIHDAEKGYDIARDGLNTIGAIKKGDFHLHLDHFNSLLQINPELRKYSKAIEIIIIQSDIKKLYPATQDKYINSVFGNLLIHCDANTKELNMLLSADNYKMTDDERLHNIDKLYADMKDMYDFAKCFASDIKILSVQEGRDKNDVKTSRLLNNIKLP